jgi:hypothetical protein
MNGPPRPKGTLLLLLMRPERPSPDRSDVRVKTVDREEEYKESCPHGNDQRRIRAVPSHDPT